MYLLIDISTHQNKRRVYAKNAVFVFLVISDGWPPEADPNNAEAWYLLTQVWLHEGKIRTIPIGPSPLLLCARGQLLLYENKKDSVFGMYETQYPDQCFGYYWRARSDAAIDTSMSTGMAVPHYLRIIEIDGKDTANKTNKKHLIESYGYIAAYRANTQKDYPGAIDYFEKLLELDPGNTDARKYVAILKKSQSKAESKAATAATTSSAGASSAGAK